MSNRLGLRSFDSSDFRISVVLPVFSETDTIREVVKGLQDILGARLLEIVIVVSPRSGEDSRDVCAELGKSDARIRMQMQQVNPGLGHGVREGYAATRGNWVLNIDSDGEMEMETVRRMLEKADTGSYDLVVASRWMKGGGFSGYSRLKYGLNFIFQQVFRSLFLTRVNDLTYGFKLMRGELARGIRWEGARHEIACETTMKPIKLGARACAVPSKWTARTSGESKNTFWRTFRYVDMAFRILCRGAEYTPPAGTGPAA